MLKQVQLIEMRYNWVQMRCNQVQQNSTNSEHLVISRSGQATPLSMEQKNVCHIRIDDCQNSLIKLCPRCHGVGHLVSECSEFGNLSCPRCLQWDHWEDSCPSSDVMCDTCNTVGHLAVVHSAEDYKQRRMVVDTLGWEPFREWFYELSYRYNYYLNFF